MCFTDFIDWKHIHSWLVFSTQFVNCYPHGRRNYKDTKPLMSSLLVIFVWCGEAILSSLLLFNKVYRLEIPSVMLVFLAALRYFCPSTFSLASPPLPKYPVNVHCVAAGGWGRGVLSCVVDHLLQNLQKLLRHPKQN
jgi:hypothetical protein